MKYKIGEKVIFYHSESDKISEGEIVSCYITADNISYDIASDIDTFSYLEVSEELIGVSNIIEFVTNKVNKIKKQLEKYLINK